MVWGETDEETNNLRTRQCMARYVEAKQKWAIEKPKLDNARQLRGISFIEPNDEGFKPTMKAARRKLEVAMPCKTPANCRGETCRNIEKHKTKCACIVDADEYMRIRLEGVPHRYHEGSHLRERNKFIEPEQSGTHVYSDASSIKNTISEGCSGKRNRKIRENTGMAADESQKQKRGDRRSKE